MEIHSHKVLLVDSRSDVESEFRELISGIDTTHLELTWVRSYADGVEKVLHGDFDVTFIGYQLDERNGVDLIRDVSGIGVYIPLILVSDIESRRLNMDAVAAGAADFVARKSLTPCLLERVVRYAVNHRDTERKLRESKDELVRHMVNLRDSMERYEAQGTKYVAMAEELAMAKGELEEALSLAKESERLLADHSPVGIWQLSVDGYTLYVNVSFRKLFEIDDLEDIRGVTCDQFFLPEFREAIQDAHLSWCRGESSDLEVQAVSRKTQKSLHLVVSGVPLTSGGGMAHNLLATVVDITARKEVERTIQHMAQHDALTDLPNRMLFSDRLEIALANAKRTEKRTAVLFLDLDQFKDINDTLGHAVGDMLLQEVSQRLIQCARDTDTVARLGGDEFAVVSTFLTRVDDIHHLSDRILAALSEPFILDGNEIRTGTSIGISIYPDNSRDPDQLLKFADMALYSAKNEGRGTYRFFGEEMDKEVRKRRTIEQDLRRALENLSLQVFYQPQVDIRCGRVVGAEALVRWHHEERGWVSPAEFIPVAESSGLIGILGEWVLQTACLQVREWRNSGWADAKVSVNVSAAQLRDDGFIDSVERTLKETAIMSDWLELEITESVVMERIDQALQVLHEINELDILMSIDDFGTGFSSLAYLKRLPVGKLKIDKSFIQDIPHDADDSVISRMIIDIARNLNMSVIAEGVEDRDQVEFLLSNGCDCVQGYYYGKPVPADEFSIALPVMEPA